MEISVTQASNGFIQSKKIVWMRLSDTVDLGRPCNSLFEFQVVTDTFSWWFNFVLK